MEIFLYYYVCGKRKSQFLSKMVTPNKYYTMRIDRIDRQINAVWYGFTSKITYFLEKLNNTI